MSVTSPDFESGAYTNFATPASCRADILRFEPKVRNRTLSSSRIFFPIVYFQVFLVFGRLFKTQRGRFSNGADHGKAGKWKGKWKREKMGSHRDFEPVRDKLRWNPSSAE